MHDRAKLNDSNGDPSSQRCPYPMSSLTLPLSLPTFTTYCLDTAFLSIRVPINILGYIGSHLHSHVTEDALSSFILRSFSPPPVPCLLISILFL